MIKRIKRKAQLGNQTMGIVFLVLVIMVGLAFFAGHAIFYGSEYEFRKTDAELLKYVLHDCIANGLINWSLTDLEEELTKKCNLNKDRLEKYIVKIELDGIEKFDIGDEVKCGKVGGKEIGEKNKNYPRCARSAFFIKFNNEEKEVFILTGSNQLSQGRLA